MFGLLLLAGSSRDAFAQGAFTSDDFNTCGGLDPRWSVVDPRGAGTVDIVGAGTNDAKLSIRVASGVSTDAWGSNKSVRLIQAATNGDFIAEMRIDSVPAVRYQMVGLLVEQDQDNWLRFDFYSNGSTLYAFAGSTSNGSSSLVAQSAVSPTAELYVRVARTGDLWAHQYSTDGSSWTTNATFTRSLNVSGVGPFAGSAGPSPGFDALIDYVFDAAAPIVPEDGDPAGEAITIGTAVLGNGSGTIVRDPDQPTYSCGDIVTLTAAPSPGSDFIGWTGDVTGSVNPLVLVVSNNITVEANFAVAGPPDISNVQVVPGARSAVISWETSEPALGRVDFGMSPAYGDFVQSTEYRVQHSMQLLGLETESTYHFSITATDVDAEFSTTPDALFATVASLGPVSDDFSQCGPLDPIWTLEDPVGGAFLDFVGSGTTDAMVRLSLPGGSSRDAWSSNNSTRILQVCDDSDLSLEAHFDSTLAGAYQLQGILVEEGPSDWIRFDFYSDGSRVYIFSAVTVGGSSSARHRSEVPSGVPLTIRVQRTGDDWSQRWSMDGGSSWFQAAQFTHSMGVTRAGLFAGSAGSPAPAFTMLADYFFDVNAPIVPEDGTPGGGSFTIVTSTSGAGTGLIQLEPDQPTYSCGDVVVATAISGPGASFVGWSGALAGATNPSIIVVGGDLAIAADFALASPPTVSNLTVAPQIHGASVTWTTDVPATSVVEYGLTSTYGSTVEDITPKVAHSIALTGLAPDTPHQLRVTSSNAFGADVVSGVPFITLPTAGPRSDDFNRCSGLGDRWTLHDPVGGASAALVGAGSGDASVIIDVPGGSVRDPWGSNSAVRVMQPSDDRDFVLEVSFDDLPSESIQMEGILVEQDNSNWLRFDFFSLGSGAHIFAARTVAGSSAALFNSPITAGPGPVSMRVERSGDSWMQSWSSDGGATWQGAASFVHPLVVTSVGILVGTAGSSPPATTVGVDFFVEGLDPLLDEDGPIETGPYSISVPGDGTVMVQPQLIDYFCGDEVFITAVPPPGMVFFSWTGDLEGSPVSTLVSMSGDIDTLATFEPAPPPVILGVTVYRASRSALVRWGTDVPSTSQVDYGLSSAYGTAVSSSLLSLSHEILLTGLLPGTAYHFQVTSQPTGGLAATTGDVIFTTEFEGLSISEDFGLANIDRSIWSFIDPGQDGALRIDQSLPCGSALVLSIPGGRAHNAWESNDSVRVERGIADVDFDISVKTTGNLDSAYQSQGLVFSADPTSGDFVRVDFYHTGGELRVFAATTVNGASTARLTTTVATGPWSGDLYLRVQRSGDQWTVHYSTFVPSHDTSNLTYWHLVGSFTHSIELESVGPCIGNSGSTPPPHTAAFDWFFETYDPIFEEDPVGASDVTPPFIYTRRVSVLGADSAIIRWSTDEPTGGVVRIGETIAYEIGSVPSSTPGGFSHDVLVNGLEATTGYQFEIVSFDSIGLETRQTGAFVTTEPGGGGPEPQFEFWYADLQVDGSYRQEFGANGLGQLFCNVLGNVSDLDGEIDILRYSLNGGPAIDLSMGPDTRRLLSEGDFNIDLHISDLVEGSNQVTIEATDQWQNLAVAEVVVDFTSSVIRSPNALIDWSAVQDLTDVAQPIDGQWTVQNSSLTTIGSGYDRLLAFGDVRWSDFEIEVPFTVHTIFEDGFVFPSGFPLIGFALRWREHTSSGQPRYGYWPTGALAYYGFDDTLGDGQVELRGNLDSATAYAYPSFDLGVEHIMKARVTTLPGGDSEYRFKMWRSGTTEPPWGAEIVLPPGDPLDPNANPAEGSPVLISHHLEVDFGTVRVERLDVQ